MSGVSERIRLSVPVIVEGKYDKARLSQVVDAVIVPTDGFAVFNNAEKRAMIRRLGERGVILLSDSDGGGRLIRSHLRGMLDGIPVYDVYAPAIRGKEPRKSAPSKAGILGVEGVPNDVLRGLFEKLTAAHPELLQAAGEDSASSPRTPDKNPVTKALLYELGLNGTAGSSERRAAVAEALGLPRDMTVNAFCAAVNLISSEEEVRRKCSAFADLDSPTAQDPDRFISPTGHS